MEAKVKSKETEKPRTDWLGIICVLFMLIGGILISYYFITEKIQSCTSSPIRYAADLEAKNGNFSYNYAILAIYTNRIDTLPIKTVEMELNPDNYKYPDISPNSSK
jgi:hypothetical protein